MSKKIKIARVVTVPIVYTHILDLLDAIYLNPKFELHLICGSGDYLSEMKSRYPLANFHIIQIPREIDIFNDLKALFHLSILYVKHRFIIVHSHTPKAGLLSAVAGFITFIPNRFHTYTGQVWANLNGPKRGLLKCIDKLISILNTHNYADSYGQKNYLLQEKVCSEAKISVIHKGSLGGVNVERFNPHILKQEIKELKAKHFPNFEGKIILYLGRLNKDKGLKELKEAFFELKKRFSIKLLLVGPIETLEDVVFKKVVEELKANNDVIFINFTSKPEIYLGVGDIFCFPSYREGFGTVALEASAMEKPIVASDIYGLADAVANNESGLLFKTGEVKDLQNKIEILLKDPDLAAHLGKQGRKRVVKDFSDKVMTEKVIEEYLNILKG